MPREIVTVDIFDLLNKKHREARDAIANRWNDRNEIQLTNSEWFILDLINYGKELIADVGKNGKFTRQGTHKLIRKLEKRGLVKTEPTEHNKRSKYVQLTPLGIICYEENKELKTVLEERIRHTLGDEKYEDLVTILSMDWEL
ncbi:MarR family winged helix-turn-helix transcriptional regulator [Oceanobacillus alkalisoli]|uniref:MarR family winged helix-turn-helix transcriptional regulator n=1 Tax=Oceanobacillus alkalisoli TaxID=2925113 RepID=UPI001F11C3BB|nr:MarR family winged helix-turn-helix transcriptional regulator [Oceanobacillus alkalisoli]MCF3944845.1 MarR family winged helix-turn-helix transcriptional regulator [Oceanobacillus alkalisoli]